MPGVVTSLNVRFAGPQASLAVGVVKSGVIGHSTVTGAGKVEIVGAVVSTTLMVCEAVEALPQASVAVHVRVTE